VPGSSERPAAESSSLRELWLGLDTGGTYTDAVLLEGGHNVVASAKALTTREDLAVGLAEAIRAILPQLPRGYARRDIRLVSVSTTLATNAVVEKRFNPIASILIGFDERMTERSGLLGGRADSPVLRIAGGHAATGEEAAPLDEPSLRDGVRRLDPAVEAFAIASLFSVRNPAHELRARAVVRELTHKPVTCAHELSSKLDAPRRALTAALNARLTPQIRHLVEAVQRVLSQEHIAAPLMVVKGDGSLMSAEVALECPVETILSGPAASVVGAGFLTGLKDFCVSDMGGTTTDIAVLAAGRPVINVEGALVGGWRTMVEAVDVHTYGLGGDSEVRIDSHGHLQVGPRRAMPLSLLASQWPALLEVLRRQSVLDPPPERAGRFALRSGAPESGTRLTGIQQELWDALASGPQLVAGLIPSASRRRALDALADAGLVLYSAITPSDAMHVLGQQSGWNREAAELGLRVLAVEERNVRRLAVASSALELCERIHEYVVRAAGRAVLTAGLAHDPGLQAGGSGFGALGHRLLEDTVAGGAFSRILDVRFALGIPLVAIGGPVGAYYPEIARRLGAALEIPEHAAVCNAVGAVAGVVSQTVDVLVEQPSDQLYRVYDPAGIRDYDAIEPALEHARRVSHERARAAALGAGAADPSVETAVHEKSVEQSGRAYLVEAIVRSIATGRPAPARDSLSA
jgi:N-methylhydantoinase A/oxoprolinase/acetone carboxylase beta subunit